MKDFWFAAPRLPQEWFATIPDSLSPTQYLPFQHRLRTDYDMEASRTDQSFGS